MNDDDDIETRLDALRDGSDADKAAFLESLYADLRRRADGLMRKERGHHTLQPTALVHEAWMRLSDDRRDFDNRAHFFGAAAEAMRRILVDRARRRAAEKRGGDRVRVTFHDLAVESAESSLDLLALDDALSALDRFDKRLSEMVKLRFFVGLSVEETAEVLDKSRATVVRDWTYARAWLEVRLADAKESEKKRENRDES